MNILISSSVTCHLETVGITGELNLPYTHPPTPPPSQLAIKQKANLMEQHVKRVIRYLLFFM